MFEQKNLNIWFPPIVDISPAEIRPRPLGPDDCQFWQYPCSTEEQAKLNHLQIKRGENIDHRTKQINTYLALPWATFIDKKNVPENLKTIISAKLKGLGELAVALGYSLKIHSVCQQIHWRRLIPLFNQLGVTDLHISHHEVDIDPGALGIEFRIHSWPLIAVNVETPERAAGLTFGKKLSERTYLASFVGAHMDHYRSDVRVKLFEAAQDFGRADVLVDLGNEWHFNKIVYEEQVLSKPISADDARKHEDRTVRYNRTLSDSVFSLCPEGAGPNTLRVWESMAVGSIPVIFADDWIPPDIPGSGIKFEDCVISIRSEDVHKTFDYMMPYRYVSASNSWIIA